MVVLKCNIPSGIAPGLGQELACAAVGKSQFFEGCSWWQASGKWLDSNREHNSLTPKRFLIYGTITFCFA
jgi:hypothetical protein